MSENIPNRNYEEAAEWLGVPCKWLQTQVQTRPGFPHLRMGKYVLFSQENLHAINALHAKGGPAPTVAAGPRPAPRRRTKRPA